MQSPEEVDKLIFSDTDPLAYLTQTTLSVDDANRVIHRLKQRFPRIVGPPKEDICYATQNRQEAVRLLSAEADVCLVLGSQNSSNSQRLAEIAHESQIRAYLIDGAADICEDWFSGEETVLVTAGASALRSRSSKTVWSCCDAATMPRLKCASCAKRRCIFTCRASCARQRPPRSPSYAGDPRAQCLVIPRAGESPIKTLLLTPTDELSTQRKRRPNSGLGGVSHGSLLLLAGRAPVDPRPDSRQDNQPS